MLLLFEKLINFSYPEHFNGVQVDFNDAPFHIYWKDKEGIYQGCNDTQAKTVGFNKGRELLGKSDFDLCWANYADKLRNNDLEVLNKQAPLTAIETALSHTDDPITVFSYKNVLREKHQEVIGTFGISFKIKSETQELFKLLNNPRQQSDKFLPGNLTKRQTECLYYLVRGMTAKQIAKITQLSFRTVEDYIDAAKNKLGCQTRSELIDKALRLSAIRNLI